jgi:hypothetical protein
LEKSLSGNRQELGNNRRQVIGFHTLKEFQQSQLGIQASVLIGGSFPVINS